MEDPEIFGAPVTAFNDDTASADKVPPPPQKLQDDERKAGSESSENTKISNPGDATEVDTPKSTDLEANALRSSSVSRSNQEQEKSDETIDTNIVDWDGPNDPSNPMNWPPWKIKTHIFLVSSITFIR